MFERENEWLVNACYNKVGGVVYTVQGVIPRRLQCNTDVLRVCTRKGANTGLRECVYEDKHCVHDLDRESNSE